MPDSATTWRFKHCNSPADGTEEIHECSISIRDTEQDVHRFLVQHIADGKQHSMFTFHLADERCDVHRPLAQLSTTCRPTDLDGQTVLVHWDHSDVDPYPPTTDVAREDVQDGPTTDIKRNDSAGLHNGEDNEKLATIHLEFNAEYLRDLPLADDVWEEETFEISIACTLSDFEDQIMQQIITNIGQDDDLLFTIELEGVDGLLAFSIGKVTSVLGQAALALTEADLNIETVADLFDDPNAADRALNVTVDLELLPRPQAREDQTDRTINESHVSLTHKQRVLYARELRESYDGYEYEMVRLGTVHPAASESHLQPPANEVTIYGHRPSDPLLRLGSKRGILQIEALIGYYFKGEDTYTHHLQIATVLSWDFGDYCIGNVAHDQNYDYSPDDGYFDLYSRAQNKNQLHKSVQAHLGLGRKTKLRGSPKEPGSGLPFMPTYTYNRFEPGHHGLDVSEKNVDAVVCFVDRLQVDGHSGQPKLKLPYATQHIFDHKETEDSITRELLSFLGNPPSPKQSNDGGKPTNAHNLLFVELLKDTWDIQLWVLPQPKRLKKMYKLPKGREHSTTPLGAFLDGEKVRKFDCAVYMEAHILPK